MRDRQKTRFARHLRREMTDAERRLWFHLRNRAFMGVKFRRQHPVGPFVVDFACIQARLVVELDGGQHLQQGHYDSQRTAWLAAAGYRVLRFWNNDALMQTDAVLAQIHQALAQASHPGCNPNQ